MSLPIPYRLDPGQLAIDDGVSFCVAMLLAIMINAESQAFMATAFGDVRSDSKDRHHFNAFFHLDIWGTICFVIAGFGWPRKMEIDVLKFARPRLFMMITRLAGPMGNFLLASIAGSIVWLMGIYEAEDRVFHIVLSVNLTVAVYSLLPLPPLAGWSVVSALFPDQESSYQKLCYQVGPFVVIGVFLADRIAEWKLVASHIDPIVLLIFNFMKG